jgi:hypothetical protein
LKEADQVNQGRRNKLMQFSGSKGVFLMGFDSPSFSKPLINKKFGADSIENYLCIAK